MLRDPSPLIFVAAGVSALSEVRRRWRRERVGRGAATRQLRR
jgi:hypothetical protein